MRTIVRSDSEERNARQRPNFVPVKKYASRVPEPNEIGAIVGDRHEIERGGVRITTYGDAIERIFRVSEVYGDEV